MFEETEFDKDNCQKIEQIIALNHKYGSKALMKVQNFDEIQEK